MQGQIATGMWFYFLNKVRKGAKIRSRKNQISHLTLDTNGKVTHSQIGTTNESQEGSPFPAGDHKAHINRRTQRHIKHKKVNEYDQEIPQSQTADNSVAPRVRAAQPSRDIR